MEAVPAPVSAPGAGPVVPIPTSELFAVAQEYERAGRLDDAERLIGHILAAHPNQADTLHLGGIVSFKRQRLEEALQRMQQSLQFGIDTPLYLRNICEVYRSLGRLDEALETGRKAVALAPFDPLSRHNLAVIHCHRLELDEGLAAAREALALDPAMAGAHFSAAEVLLTRGEMEQGWEEYEWRFRIAGVPAPMPPTDKPQWDGKPLDGTLLLVADQGFGDVIQFMRYVAWAKARCAKLVVAASKETQALLRQAAPDALVALTWSEIPEFTAFCTLSGLPRLHGTRIDTIPWPGPYLQADPVRRARWTKRLEALTPAGYLRVGISWAGRPSHSNDRNRSTTLPMLRLLGNAPRVALVSLQKGDPAAQTGAWFGRAPLVGLGPELKDYDDTMAVIDALDLVISVDTSVGHLAGAMGKPVWLMLPYVPDWRWLLDREDTPWYPGHRLFRQTADRSWQNLAQRVSAALQEWSHARREAPALAQ